MKALIIHKKGYFGHLFGQTFEVVDIHPEGRISLGIGLNCQTTDFSFKEVLIVDFQQEIQSTFDDKNWIPTKTTTMPSSPKVWQLYEALKAYGIENRIAFYPIYNCPT